MCVHTCVCGSCLPHKGGSDSLHHLTQCLYTHPPFLSPATLPDLTLRTKVTGHTPATNPSWHLPTRATIHTNARSQPMRSRLPCPPQTSWGWEGGCTALMKGHSCPFLHMCMHISACEPSLWGTPRCPGQAGGRLRPEPRPKYWPKVFGGWVLPRREVAGEVMAFCSL